MSRNGRRHRINRGFSAPIKLSLPIEAEDLRFLAAHDSDPFNRWQAVQTLAMSLLRSNVAALRDGATVRDDEGLMAALGAILVNDKIEPAFIALNLVPRAIPTSPARSAATSIPMQSLPRAGNCASPSARDTLRAVEHLRADNTGGPYSPDAKSTGRRALKNVCLDLYGGDPRQRRDARGACQYTSADNMTDRMAALETLAQHDRPERAAVLDDFYRAVCRRSVDHRQYGCPAADHLGAGDARPRARADRPPAFSMGQSEPGALADRRLAQANHTQFTASSGGAGYDFVADIVLKLDPKNHRSRPASWARSAPGARSKRGGGRARRRRCGRCGDAQSVERRTTSSPARSPTSDPPLEEAVDAASSPQHRRASELRAHDFFCSIRAAKSVGQKLKNY